MAADERASILRRIARMTAEVGGASDAQFLERFVASRDEAAFELLLWRHARLVFHVCQRVLHSEQDAEDAFQATFLALARHASRIARREAVASWLHKVAYRVALTARGQDTRRQAREQRAGSAEQLVDPANVESAAEARELRDVLDREVEQLPKRFRAAVVLCYLEGKSVDEAAVLLGCPRGTVASRLARARKQLRVRLAKRGLAVTAGLVAGTGANAERPFHLIPTLTAAAARAGAGSAAADGILSRRITGLTEEVLHAMLLDKFKAGLVALALGILLVGGGLAVRLQAKDGPEAEPPAPAKDPGEPASRRAEAPEDKPAAKAPHPVTVSLPKRREFTPHEEFTGRLEARRSAEVHPAVGGFVEKVCFKAGAEVKKGDVLFELDSRAARLALDKAQADLAAAEAKVKQADANLQRARKLAQDATNEPERGTAVDAVNKGADRLADAQAGVRPLRVEVSRCQLELAATRVTAPLSGQVGRPLVEPGALVFRGPDRATLLTTVTSLDPIGVVFQVDERSFLVYQRLLREKKVEGPGGRLHLAVADDQGFPREGTLDGFEDRVNAGNGTVAVRGSFPNPDQLLLPGMYARIRMTFGPPRPALTVPEAAILTDQGKKYVLVVNGRNVAERREVTLGPIDNGMRIVEKGLSAEDRVVTAGLRGVHPGDAVEPRQAGAPER